MNALTSKNLGYFVGKVCTILSRPINRQFDEKQSNDYFLGIVECVTEDGIFTTHTITGCKNFYLLKNIVGICEEQVLDPSRPEEAELIQEFKQKVTPSDNSPFVDIDLMASLAKQAKEMERKKK